MDGTSKNHLGFYVGFFNASKKHLKILIMTNKEKETRVPFASILLY
jgi:hypothetical protein